ncbi:MAG TPA: hypothetical protein VF829_01745 [Candidatus Paceibacterota bacterium]
MENTTAPAQGEVSPKHPKFVRWALLIGIVVILNVFFFVVEQIIFPAPKYENYCPRPVLQAQDAATCDAQGGVWNEYPMQQQPAPAPTEAIKPVPGGYCDYTAKCQPVYEKALQQQHLYAFVLMTVLGIIALVIGVVPIGSSIVSSGLSYGGVVALVIGAMQYWGDAGQWLRLAISAIALAALIWIGVRRFRDEH